LWLGIYTGKFSALLNDGAWQQTSTLLQINRWYHLVFTYDKNGISGQQGKLYVNGINEKNISYSSSIQSSTYSDKIGAIYNGSIADVRIYNRALSAEEIVTLNNSYNPKLSAGSLQKV